MFGAKVVPKWRQHCHKSVASVRQRENAEGVEDLCSVGDGGEQPVQVVLVGALREEGDDAEKPSGIRAEFLEHRRSERKFDCGGKAPGVLCVKYFRSLSLPFSSKSVGVHLLYWATVASKVIDRGWKPSCSKMSSTESDCSPCL